MDNQKVIYTPEGKKIESDSGFFLLSRQMVRELASARWLVWMLFLRDFSAKYRQSALGVIWAILTPLITVGLFVGMSHSGILMIQNVNIPYPLYAIIGLTIWNLFTVGLIACAGSLVNAGSMVVKINFPKVALVLASSWQGIVEFLIRLLLIAAAFMYYGVAPSSKGLILGLLCVIPLYLLMTGIGFFMSLATGVMRDIPNMLNIVLSAFMLLTPILYPITGNSWLARANVWNPFNYLVNVPRDLILKGQTDMVNGFVWASILSAIVFYIGWKLFYLAQTKIAERI
jgi:lipopolysaccharide transport system permease protein